ncbi:TRAP transporter small permease [Acuticoccus sp. I52.16.1]|uniref:TRAP transporter small permease n=1 Tax=Acuticoccus sp. I52.16.1 TaxID=2928472 RepID=UPI001FD26AE5|nr:TRAP transporter small permease [Acuticoccus sp. I52.16.1]UOM36590.1 TRAP transporter small permease [Acuticoccus sp. I52.16.1]
MQAFWKTIEILTVATFLGALFVMFLQVAARYAIGTAVPWTDETSRCLFIASIFIGAALCQRRSEHTRITVLLDHLSPSARRACEFAANVLSAIIAAALAYGALDQVLNGRNQMLATLPISFSWLYAIQGLSLSLMLLLLLRSLWTGIGPNRGRHAE